MNGEQLKVFQWLIEADQHHRKTNDVQCIVYDKAISNGWNASKEYPAPYGGTGKFRNGRVDLMLCKGDQRFAIEIDDYTVKEKSIFKLRTLDAYRIGAVMRGDVTEIPRGLDAVLSIATMTVITKEDGEISFYTDEEATNA